MEQIIDGRVRTDVDEYRWTIKLIIEAKPASYWAAQSITRVMEPDLDVALTIPGYPLAMVDASCIVELQIFCCE